MIIIGCSNAVDVARKIARKTKSSYFALKKDYFPDGELLVRFTKSVKGKKVVIVQSFYPDPQEALVEAVWAVENARKSGAKHITLVAPYLGYMRQDKEFEKGQAISAHIMADLLSVHVNHLVTVDPHLHRIRKLKEVFSCKTTTLTANGVLAEHIKKNIKNAVVVGPDWESYQWADEIAGVIGSHAVVLKKKRYSSHHVSVSFNEKVSFKGKNVVIVDDVVSTGHTIAEAAKAVRKKGAKSVYCITVHGVFAGDALQLMKKAGVTHVAATNTIRNSKAVIDVSSLIAEALK